MVPWARAGAAPKSSTPEKSNDGTLAIHFFMRVLLDNQERIGAAIAATASNRDDANGGIQQSASHMLSPRIRPLGNRDVAAQLRALLTEIGFGEAVARVG
jgi:hypothetical protein